ncbi:MAG: serine/threonine protein kinase [Proteobacteria bacterium]|nr:serine/threonine protein kinase [Pseudomonadota bacterium]
MRSQHFGPYTLLRRLGDGGMAEVFLAKEQKSIGVERLVAIKRIHPHLAKSSRFTSMLVDEANIAGKLTHANIARILDVGNIGGEYFIAMEYVHGRDLRSVFNRHKKMGLQVPNAHACYMGLAICEGLDYAHNYRDYCGRELGLVHRDISPHNVILSFDGELKIIDFGVAKAVGRLVRTETGAIKGKLTYMSPEQVRGLPIDRRSDVFATGIVLFELLTGQRLFLGRTVANIVQNVRDAVVPDPRHYNPKLTPKLQAIVLRALAKEPGNRYQSAEELRAELAEFIRSEGLYVSRARVADWLRNLYAEEYAAESTRTAQLWSLASSRPSSGSPFDDTDDDTHGDDTHGETRDKNSTRGRHVHTTPGWVPALYQEPAQPDSAPATAHDRGEHGERESGHSATSPDENKASHGTPERPDDSIDATQATRSIADIDALQPDCVDGADQRSS